MELESKNKYRQIWAHAGYNSPMTTTAKRWPHPTVRVSTSDAAGLLGVSRTTLSKPIARIRDGLPPGTRKPEIGIAAGIFAAQATGPVPRVEAGALIDALCIPASRVDQTPPPLPAGPKERRHRLSKKEVAQMRRLPPQKIYGVFQKAAEHVATRNNPNARRLLKEVIDVMLDRQIPLPAPMIEGIKTERFRAFATLADWTALAGPEDYRLFVLIEQQDRPTDYPIVPKKFLRSAEFRFLSLAEWLNAMKKGLGKEKAARERVKIDKATGPAKAPSRGHLKA